MGTAPAGGPRGRMGGASFPFGHTDGPGRGWGVPPSLVVAHSTVLM